MASKVPKFGSWENGDVGYTACFEVARKGNSGGPIINPNDIQMNRDVSPSTAPPNHNKPKPKQQQQQQQRQQLQQPKFGAWDSGDEVPYTQFFENKGKTNPSDQPQMNRDVVPTRQPGKAPPMANNVPHPKPQGVKFVGGDLPLELQIRVEVLVFLCLVDGMITLHKLVAIQLFLINFMRIRRR